jgi:hypothetical protein
VTTSTTTARLPQLTRTLRSAEHAPAARQHAGKAAEAARAAAREAEQRREFARLRGVGGGAAAGGATADVSEASRSAPHYGLDEPPAAAFAGSARGTTTGTSGRTGPAASASMASLRAQAVDFSASSNSPHMGLTPPTVRFVAVMDGRARLPPVVGYATTAWGRGTASSGGRVEPAGAADQLL